MQCRAAMPPAKTRLKPYLDDETESLEALRLHVSGRTARLRQAGLDDAAPFGAVQREILVLAMHGYPREMLLRVWSRSRQYPAAARLLRTGRLGADLSWFVPAQAALDLGHARDAAVGSVIGPPLQAHSKLSKSKCTKKVVCWTLLTALLAHGPGTGWRFVGAPLVVFWGIRRCAPGSPGGASSPPLPPPPLRPPFRWTLSHQPAAPAPPSLSAGRGSLARSLACFFLASRCPALLVPVSLLPRSGLWRAARVSDSDPLFPTRMYRPSRIPDRPHAPVSCFPDPGSRSLTLDLCFWERA